MIAVKKRFFIFVIYNLWNFIFWFWHFGMQGTYVCKHKRCIGRFLSSLAFGFDFACCIYSVYLGEKASAANLMVVSMCHDAFQHWDCHDCKTEARFIDSTASMVDDWHAGLSCSASIWKNRLSIGTISISNRSCVYCPVVTSTAFWYGNWRQQELVGSWFLSYTAFRIWKDITGYFFVGIFI